MFQTPGEALVQAQRGLRGGAQHRADPVVARQFVQQRHARAQQCVRQGLCFVQNHDAAGDVVQLAATGRAIGEQALEELHCGSDDDRRVPVLHGQFALVDGLRRLGRIVEEGAVVLQHDVVALLYAQCLPEYLHGLFDDAGERNHVDHPAQPMCHGMVQGECQ